MRALRYSFDEALASLWRGRQSRASVDGTIALALFVLGAFLLVTAESRAARRRMEQCGGDVRLPRGRRSTSTSSGGDRGAVAPGDSSRPTSSCRRTKR